MVADIHRDDFSILNKQLQRDAERQIDGHRMQAAELAAQGVQAQRRMGGIDLQHLQCLEVLLAQLRVAFQELKWIRISRQGFKLWGVQEDEKK